MADATPPGPAGPDFDFDYLIIGSGFGGSVSALRLTERGNRVGVVEMGRRWSPDNLPSTNWIFWRFLWRPMIGLRGFFNVRPFRHVMILHGNAVGGGSITYANTLLVPPEKVWDEGSWAGLDDWHRVMPGHYATARRMLGVTPNKRLAAADYTLRKMADNHGVGDSFYPTDVGVFFGKDGEPEGKAYPDPYFGGEGPERNSCIGCGGCMVGCRHNAKNTLDKNYLYLAEKRGARVYAETEVVDLRPLDGREDGAGGYEVHTVKSTAWFNRQPRRYTARSVVFAAGSLGTQQLLFKLKQSGSLPNISDQLGNRVRTNAESLIGIRMPKAKEDMSKGVAIGSGIYIDEHTHVEATRYPANSDLLSFTFTPLTDGKPNWTRILLWLWTFLLLLLTRPLLTLRAINPVGFAKQTMILLCMQTLDGFLNMRFRRPWYNPFTKVLVTEGDPIPTYIPAANEFARKSAALVDGIACSGVTEILFNIPMTAHCMGGCAMADTPERGVIDRQNRVFGYRNMYVCDGSMLGSNLGVNPSLTITALAERAMSFIPPAKAAN
ncbi:MAG: GMC oxidoreductase [Stenotrophobium sp.]